MLAARDILLPQCWRRTRRSSECASLSHHNNFYFEVHKYDTARVYFRTSRPSKRPCGHLKRTADIIGTASLLTIHYELLSHYHTRLYTRILKQMSLAGRSQGIMSEPCHEQPSSATVANLAKVIFLYAKSITSLKSSLRSASLSLRSCSVFGCGRTASGEVLRTLVRDVINTPATLEELVANPFAPPTSSKTAADAKTAIRIPQCANAGGVRRCGYVVVNF